MLNMERIYKEYEPQITNDDPIAVKTLFTPVGNMELLLYPVTMDKYYDFMLFSTIISLNKNNTNDIKIIKMSYLEFLLYLVDMELSLPIEERLYSNLLYGLIELVTQKHDVKIIYDTKSIVIDGFRLSSKEFELFRGIVLAQNKVNYKESNINPELQKELDEANRLRTNGRKPITLEKQMITLTLNSAMSLEDVKKLTIRKFDIAMEMMDRVMSYKIDKTAERSGNVKFKNDITHYLFEEKERDQLISADSFTSKFSNT